MTSAALYPTSFVFSSVTEINVNTLKDVWRTDLGLSSKLIVWPAFVKIFKLDVFDCFKIYM